MRKIFFLAPALLLVGCAALTDTTTTVVAAETAYAGAVSAEIVWLNSPAATPALAKQVEGYRVAAHNALAPLEAQAAAGTPPTNEQALAATAAVNALTSFLAANNIKGNK